MWAASRRTGSPESSFQPATPHPVGDYEDALGVLEDLAAIGHPYVFTFNQIAETEAWLSDLRQRFCG